MSGDAAGLTVANVHLPPSRRAAVDFDSPIVVIYATWIAAIIETDREEGEGRGVLAPDRRTNSSPVCATGDITCNLLAPGMRACNLLNV